MSAPEQQKRSPGLVFLQAALPWLLVLAIGSLIAFLCRAYLTNVRGSEPIVWRTPRAIVLVAGGGLVGLIAFHLQRRRVAAMGFCRRCCASSRCSRSRSGSRGRRRTAPSCIKKTRSTS